MLGRLTTSDGLAEAEANRLFGPGGALAGAACRGRLLCHQRRPAVRSTEGKKSKSQAHFVGF